MSLRQTATDALSTAHTKVDETSTRAKTTLIGTFLLLQLSSGTAAAQVPAGCSVPTDLQPVFDLLEAITQVTLLGGISIAALGIGLGGVMIMWPGQDMTRRGKSVITYTIIGTVIILSAHAIVSFVTSQMGTTICP